MPTMHRRDLLKRSTAFGLLSAIPGWGPEDRSASSGVAESPPLKPPPQGSIPVAFVVSDGAVIIDFCGPWEVFQDVGVPGRDGDAFHLYTVAETTTPIRASGGMGSGPPHSFEAGPPPQERDIGGHRGSEAAGERVPGHGRAARQG